MSRQVEPVVGNFVRGALYPARGLGRILSDARLLGLSVLPVLAGAAVYAALAWVLWRYSGAWFDAILPAARSGGAWRQIVEALRWILYLAFCAILGIAAVLSFANVVRVAGAPFLDAMSLRTEKLLQPGFRDPGLGPSVLGEIALEIRKFVVGLLCGGLCLVVNLVLPGSGVALGLYLALYFLSMDFLGYAMGRRGLQAKERLSFRRQNFGKVWGFAVASFVLLLTPIVSLIVVPCCVVGGTMLYVENAGRPDG